MGEVNKRFRLFEYKNNDYLLDMNDAVGLDDPNVDYLEFLGQALPIEDICDLLNQLNDENHLLRVELDTHKHPLWSTREAERIVNELKEENEQLKQQIKTLADAIDRGDFR